MKSKKKIKVVDLFSGVGGLTFGFTHEIRNKKMVKSHVFDILFANDFSLSATKAFSNNYPDICILNESIEKIDSKYLKDHGIDVSNADVIIGGPPCQSYSTIGKRKNDDRAKMYKEFRRILDIIRPKLFIFENVTGILSFKDDNGNKIIDEIINDFKDLGYRTYIKTLNARDYGVPQNRLRVFLVGVKEDVKMDWQFPKPIKGKFISVKDAIDDLPEVINGENADRYLGEPTNDYQRLMRSNSSFFLTEHTAGVYGDRINHIIANLGPGEKHDDINRKVLAGDLPNSLFLTSGYNNSYARLLADKPSATITNNFGTPSANRCIHPYQNRALTIREAARLQSFPDDFVFYGTITEKRKQIGNAVPPLLSIALAKSIKKFIDNI